MNAIVRKLKSRAVDYVMARLCRNGGFCFYRLEEPNGADTYYALAILDLLNVPFRDRNTESFLQGLQHADGTYDGIYAAFYSLCGLRLLDRKPVYDPGPYVAGSVGAYRLDADHLPAEVTSLFQRPACLVDLFLQTGLKATRKQRDRFIRLILEFRNSDGGFGYRRSTLTDTAHALRMLQGLSYPVASLRTEKFIRQCEVIPFGFTDMPGSSLSYLEYLDAGVSASQIGHFRPRYLEACVDFVAGCQNRNGGFARAGQGGISTLENTFYAVRSLKILEVMNERRETP